MPCHVPSTTTPRARRRPSLSLLMGPPKMVATLDLTSETEQKIHAIIQRFHTGRWPLFRCHALRRVGSLIYEVAEWRPYRTDGREPKFSVVTWTLTEIGLSWSDYATLDAAREAFATLIANPPAVAAAAQ